MSIIGSWSATILCAVLVVFRGICSRVPIVCGGHPGGRMRQERVYCRCKTTLTLHWLLSFIVCLDLSVSPSLGRINLCVCTYYVDSHYRFYSMDVSVRV